MRTADQLGGVLAALGEIRADLATKADHRQLSAELDRIGTAIGKISPVHVDLDEKLGRVIAAKLADPLTVPAEIAALWAEQARRGQVQNMYHIGYGPDPCVIVATIHPNGTLAVVLSDCNQQRFWSGVLHGPEAA